MNHPQRLGRGKLYLQSLYQFLWVVSALWGVELVDRFYFEQNLEFQGIHPGNWSHWEGILLAPFLHGDWDHLVGNSIWLLAFGGLILVSGWQSLMIASLLSIIVGGVFVMFVGSENSYHIGASGVVYGYFAYLIAKGYYEKTGSSVAISLLLILGYGGFVYGMLPSDYNKINHISWEGHLGGALGGLFAAKRPRRR